MTAGEHGKVALHWIDGAWVDSHRHRHSVNPATGEVIGSYAMGTPEQAESAVAASKRAFAAPGWRSDRAQ
jgi:betaine-aldehyde dehydrogenase